MDVCQLDSELKRRGIELRLSNDRTRMGLGRGQSSLLTPEMSAALRDNYDYLIRGALLRASARDLQERMTTQAGLSRDDPEYGAAYAAVGHGFADDYLEEAWDGPVEGFRDALGAYFAPAYEALEAALEHGSQADTDEPALFAASRESPANRQLTG